MLRFAQQFEGVFYKAASIHNEDSLPVGVEQAAFHLAEVLVGPGTQTPTTLLTLTRVSFFPHHDLPDSMRASTRALRTALHEQQQALGKKTMQRQGKAIGESNTKGSGEGNTTGSGTQTPPASTQTPASPFQCKDFLNAQPELEAEIQAHRRWFSRVVQASAAIAGTPLDDVVTAEQWGALDPRSLSAAVVAQLLTTAADAKGDNVLVTAAGAVIGVDNDHALGLPYRRRANGSLRVTLRSLLLCCPHVLQSPVHAAVTASLAERPAAATLLSWLARMDNVNGGSVGCFSLFVAVVVWSFVRLFVCLCERRGVGQAW